MKQKICKYDLEFLEKYKRKTPSLINDLQNGMSRKLACKKYKGIVSRNPILKLKGILEKISGSSTIDEKSIKFNDREWAKYCLKSVQVSSDYFYVKNAEELCFDDWKNIDATDIKPSCASITDYFDEDHITNMTKDTVIMYRKSIKWIDWCFRNVIAKLPATYFANNLKDIPKCKKKISEALLLESKKERHKMDSITEDFIKDSINMYLLEILEPQTKKLLSADKELTEKWNSDTLNEYHFAYLSEELFNTNIDFIKSVDLIDDLLKKDDDVQMMNSRDEQYHPRMFKDWLDNIGYKTFIENTKIKLISEPYNLKGESVLRALNNLEDLFEALIEKNKKKFSKAYPDIKF
ncbi:hypothetical protein [Seonamhaeicola marinus]|uniref:Uncharacterized protein n=1 Tax=Seonamhaeicola marinus TaxID=1912246 RepID=A0A5D0I4E8_9FLAO|nr:hypothetical protein [Seonamhaeicola marinus]TYA78544.1 hypothetical protein FUA24_09315 [Seonamhaeicola marinus]